VGARRRGGGGGEKREAEADFAPALRVDADDGVTVGEYALLHFTNASWFRLEGTPNRQAISAPVARAVLEKSLLPGCRLRAVAGPRPITGPRRIPPLNAARFANFGRPRPPPRQLRFFRLRPVQTHRDDGGRGDCAAGGVLFFC